MRGVLKKSSQFILVFILAVSWIFSGWPLGVSFAEEATSTPPEQTATTTPEIIPEPAIEIATTTATTTEETLEPTPESPQTGEVLGATDDNEGQEIVDEAPQSIIDISPPQPPLSVRKFEKRITVDKKAAHTCEAETFRIDISDRASAEARVMFLRDTDAPYEMEVGGLPDGINITFSKNSAYRYAQGAGDRYLTLEIRNQVGSQKGDFSIPIVYTQKGFKDSSVVCQINLVNQ